MAALAAMLARELRYRRSALSQETRIHDAIADALRSLGWVFEREHRLDKASRLDFLVSGDIAIEVKKGTAGVAELRQVGRYLEHPKVAACIIIAMRIDHRIPDVFVGKPIAKLELWRLLL